MMLIKKMQETKLTVSLGEGKRLIKQGAVEVNGKIVDNIDEELKDGQEVSIKVGKHQEFKGIV